MKHKKRLFFISMIGISIVVVIPFLVVTKIYEQHFGVRFETHPKTRYKVELFKTLTRKPYVFQSKQGVKLQGYYYTTKKESLVKGIVVLAHGFSGGGHISYMPEIDFLVKNGYDVFAYDATGNDESEGESVRGLPQGLLDLGEAVDFVKQQLREDQLPLFLYGHSWGAYAVMSYLAIDEEIEAAVALAGFNNSLDKLLEEGERRYGKKIKGLEGYMKGYEWVKFGEIATATSLEGLALTKADVLIIQSRDDHMIDFNHSFLYFKNHLKHKKNIYFLAFNDRAHDPVRTFQVQEKLRKINKLYDEAMQKGDKASETALNEAYLKVHKQIDPVLMTDIVTFYNNRVENIKDRHTKNLK